MRPLLSGLAVVVVLVCGVNAWAAGTRVFYETRVNGQAAPEEGRVQLDCGPHGATLVTLPVGEWVDHAPRERGHADFDAARCRQVATFADGTRIGLSTPFDKLPAWTLEEEAAPLEILGFSCRKASTTLRSNRIDIWFCDETPLRGGPSLGLLKPGALVLRVLRNGNHEIVATAMEPLPPDAAPVVWPPEPGVDVEAPDYRARLNQAWVRTVRVFDHERVAFTPSAVDTSAMRQALKDARRSGDSAVLRFAAGTLLLRRITLPRDPEAQLFLELTERSKGDAYDRTGSVFLVPDQQARSFLDALAGDVGALPAWRDSRGRPYQGVAATQDYAPPVELLRFITPFGVGHYNEQVKVQGQMWADSVCYKQELTELAPLLQGPVWLGAFVGNYDAGGHELTLDLHWHPGRREKAEPATAPEPWVASLFNTVNVLEMAGQEYGRLFEYDTLRVAFDVPAGLGPLRLRFISTGHGGWGGGDEFNPKVNTLLVDGAVVAAVTPWRSDCGSYRRYNPASGNFWNGLSSSDFSRSGWCPGAAAEPFSLVLPTLAAGRHEVALAIPQGAPEGDSFSAWNVSGLVMGQWQKDSQP